MRSASRLRFTLPLAALLLCSAAVYLIGNQSVALWDRDEPRYAQTSRQMLQSGDWVVPHFLDLERTAKPALIYWCQASAMRVLGDTRFAARLPSSIAILTVIVILAFALRPMLGDRRALWTCFIFATSGMVIFAAKICITDAVLLIFITIAQLCLFRVWTGHRDWPTFLIWGAATGFAGLTKGPVILGMQAMTVLMLLAMAWFDRRHQPRATGDWPPLSRLPTGGIPSAIPSTILAYRSPSPPPASPTSFGPTLLKSLIALLVTTVIALPWVLMVNHRSAQFMQKAVGHEVWDRMMTPLEQHTGPPGYYLASIWGTFFPWSLLLPLAIALAWKHRSLATHRFALAAVIGPWIMLECVRTKLPHYLLPAFPRWRFWRPMRWCAAWIGRSTTCAENPS